VLLVGTVLIQRRPSMDVTWRLGIQLLAWRAWYWARLTDGSW
jgi:hypothetical protein